MSEFSPFKKLLGRFGPKNLSEGFTGKESQEAGQLLIEDATAFSNRYLGERVPEADLKQLAGAIITGAGDNLKSALGNLKRIADSTRGNQIPSSGEHLLAIFESDYSKVLEEKGITLDA